MLNDQPFGLGTLGGNITCSIVAGSMVHWEEPPENAMTVEPVSALSAPTNAVDSEAMRRVELNGVGVKGKPVIFSIIGIN